MKTVTIRMKTRLAGPDGVRQPGDLLRVPEHVADDLIAGGYAELATAKPAEPETATVEPPEKAVSRAKRPPAKRKH